MEKIRILSKKNKCILYSKLTDYLKEVLEDEERFSTFEDLYQEAQSVEVYGNIKYLTPVLIAEWLRGLSTGIEYVTYEICVMILDFLNLDTSYAEKLGYDGSIYVESQTDIDSYYWLTLGDIIYQKGKEKTQKVYKN